MISLERLLALADVYDVPPEHLVAAVSQRLSTQADRIGIAAHWIRFLAGRRLDGVSETRTP